SLRLSISTKCSIVEVSFYEQRPFSFIGRALGHFFGYAAFLSQRHSSQSEDINASLYAPPVISQMLKIRESDLIQSFTIF
ncbi:MAG: hypothetical protein WA783_13505, partial [Phormidesmis sp.]